MPWLLIIQIVLACLWWAWPVAAAWPWWVVFMPCLVAAAVLVFLGLVALCAIAVAYVTASK